MTASPAQLTALRDFVVSCLNSDGGSFPASSVRWSPNNAQRPAIPYCALSILGTLSRGGPTQVGPIELNMLRTVAWSSVPASSEIVVALDGLIVATSSVVGASDLTDLVDQHAANLDAVSGLSSSNSGDVLQVEADSVGVELTVTPSAADLAAGATVVLVRDKAGIVMRDVLEVTVSIRVTAQRDPVAPDLAQDAGQLLERVRTRLFAPVAAEGLRAAQFPVLRYTQVRDLSRWARDSEWYTEASLDVTLGRTSVTIEQPGLIEHISGEGVFNPGNVTEPFEADV